MSRPGRPGLEVGDVPSGAQGRALVRAHRIVQATHDLGDPWQAVPENPLHPTRKSGGANGTRAAGALKLDFDHAAFHIGPDQHQVAAVGLHRWTHEVDDPVQLAQALGAFGIVQLSLGIGHPTILPCREPGVTAGGEGAVRSQPSWDLRAPQCRVA
jgi:hypothetical protein